MKQLQNYLTNRFRLSGAEWELISRHLVIKDLQKGDFFIEQNRICRNSGFILEGVMRYFSYDDKGNDPTCYFVCENQYITDPFSFRKQTVSDMNLQAVTKCNIAVIHFDSDKALLAGLAPWNDITNLMTLDVSMDFANQKELLALNASKRYDYFIEKFPTIASRTPLQYVASYLGIKQPSLSRVRKESAARKTTGSGS